MATTKYFSDINGQAIELATVWSISNAEFAARFPGVRGRRSDSFSKFVGSVAGSRDVLPNTRVIFRKSSPSLHKCGARCLSAKGSDCECACGGQNHGAGSFNCEALAA